MSNQRKYIIREVVLPGSSGDRHIVQDDSVNFVPRTNLNFTGAGVIVSDDLGNDATIINIPAGSSGASVSVAANIIARNALSPASGDLCFVQDATDDSQVRVGWAMYVYENSAWRLIAQQEDVEYQTTLGSSTETPGVGGISAGTTVGDLVGKSISAIFDDLIFPAVAPTYNAPILTLALTGVSSTTIRVGEAVNPLLTGTYTQNDAGSTASQITKRGATTIDSGDLVYTDAGIKLTSPGTINYTQEVAYNDGAIKNDSHGNPDKTGQITQGIIVSNTRTLTIVYPYFYGVGTSKPTVSADITAGTEVVAAISSEIEIDFNSTDADFIWFAVPEDTGTFTTWFINQINNGAIGTASDLFPAAISISVTDLSGYFTKNYDVYISNYKTGVTDTMTLEI